MDLRGIGIYLTYQCNSECVHCAYGSNSALVGVVEEAELDAAFAAVNTFGNLETVKILGGEPTLYMERLLTAIKLARTHGAGNIILITNGWWGNNPERARSSLKALKDAGLSVLVISVDAFHVEYVPTESVRGAIIAAANSGLFYCVTMDVIDFLDGDNPYDRQTRSILEQLGDLPFAVIPSKLNLLGRAADLLTDFFPASEAMPNDCRPPYAGSFAAPSGIAIDPLGYVTLCHGIAIGNTKKTAIGEILANYRLEDHPILNAVATKGPLGLLELAGSENMRLRSGYITSCQLCYDVRKHL